MSSQMVDSYLDELLAPLQAATRLVPAPVPVLQLAPAPEVESARLPARPAPAPAHQSDTVAPPLRATKAGHRWLRASLGSDHYAFELLRVQEVVRMATITAMRGTSRAMLGVMNLRGRIVPVFDLARWLGTGEVTTDENVRIIVVERDDELIGVLVSAVEDVVTLAREHIEPPLPGNDPGGVLGVARVGRAPTVLLDANALFE
ncbi:chemotaxis protein CheW [Lysobacter sp. A378]